MKLIGLEILILGRRVIQYLQLHPLIRGTNVQRRANPKTVIGTGRQLELEPHNEIAVLLRRVKITAAKLGLHNNRTILDHVTLCIALPAGQVLSVEEQLETVGLFLLGELIGYLTNKYVPEIKQTAVRLKLYLAVGINRLISLPVVLHHHVIDN
ncbi:hypothetical protein ES703_99429 [subsurface metagenome]